MWMKMIAFGATASIFALGACASSEDESARDPERTIAEDRAGEAPLAVEGQFCGGFAAIACPEGFTCVDDPNDECDPAGGGADCGGICVTTDTSGERRANPSECRRNDPTRSYISRNPDQCAVIRYYCEEGKQPFSDECGCGCETVVTCGSSVCGAGEYCCNASCGICAPEGGGCIQMFCEQPPQ